MKTTDIESFVRDVMNTQGWETNPSRDVALAAEELGEVAREVRRLEYGRQRPDEVDRHLDPESRTALVQDFAEEVGDLLFVLVKLTVHYGVTLEEAFELHKKKMASRYGEGFEA